MHPLETAGLPRNGPCTEKTAEKLSEFCGEVIVVSSKNIQYLVVWLQAVENCDASDGPSGRGGAILP